MQGVRNDVEVEMKAVEDVVDPAGGARMIGGEHRHVAEAHLVLPELLEREVGQAVAGGTGEALDRHAFGGGAADIVLGALLPVEEIELARILVAEHEAHVVVVARAGRQHLPTAVDRVLGLIEVVQVERGVGIDDLRDRGVARLQHPAASGLPAGKVQRERAPGRKVDRIGGGTDRGDGQEAGQGHPGVTVTSRHAISFQEGGKVRGLCATSLMAVPATFVSIPAPAYPLNAGVAPAQCRRGRHDRRKAGRELRTQSSAASCTPAAAAA